MEKQTLQSPSHQEQSQKDKGQTLAEFALTLPILLLLLFGIIEFGRLFQSWVTLQNAARTAVRYASTGQYKEERFDIEDIIVCESNNPGEKSIGDIVERTFPRGRDYGPIGIEMFDPPIDDTVADESFYATWYADVLGCSPGPETDQNRRDMLRLPSIYEEARRGAAGLLIQDSPISPTADSVENYLFSQFQRPHPDVDSLDWFDIVICSSRQKMYDETMTQIIDFNTKLPSTNPNDLARFELVLDDPDYAPAACVLREAPVDSMGDSLPDNRLDPWMDAGGPGERVTVVITFNHRLITPIGLANMVTLQAQRSAINESFRVTNAERALGPSSNPSGGAANTPTPIPASDTPIPTSTDTETPTRPPDTEVPPTNTPEPFNCDNIDVFFREVPFTGRSLFIEFANFNHEDTTLLSAEVHWDKTPAEDDFPNMHMSGMGIESDIYWFGEDYNTPTTSNNSEGTLFYQPEIPGDGEKLYWQGIFANGPANMFNYFTIYNFSGTNFTFDHPDSDTDCVITVFLPPIPTNTPVPVDYVSPTPTYTPDCASLTIRVEFVQMQIGGVVTLRIENNGPRNAPFTGFNIIWPEMSGIGLDRVVFGGTNGRDVTANGTGDGVIMWDSPFGTGDTSPNTDSETELSFLTEVTVSAYSNTLVHLVYTGVGGKVPMNPSDLNGTRFDIWCGAPGTPFGNGGGGGGNSGSIFLATQATPAPTNPPPPTWTPLSETYTPTNTPPPAIPTDTNTPRPTVATQTPSNTPPATNTHTPTPTIDISGCGLSADKC